jgi:hypothetical protein
MQQSLRRFAGLSRRRKKFDSNVRLTSKRQGNVLAAAWHFRIFIVMCA